MGKSFFTGGTHYPGGKGRAFQHVINLMPPHQRYIETHLGSGAVLRHKRRATTTVGIDIDARVVGRWRHEDLPGVEVIHGDALAILPVLSVGCGDLVYSDPPYVPATRRKHPIYARDCTAEDHVALIGLLSSLECDVIISGYRCPLYDDALSSWHRLDYTTVSRRGNVIESAWCNFNPGVLLHDYSYIGSDFRDRERRRRRVRSLASRLSSADPLELNAALAILADAQSNGQTRNPAIGPWP